MLFAMSRKTSPLHATARNIDFSKASQRRDLDINILYTDMGNRHTPRLNMISLRTISLPPSHRSHICIKHDGQMGKSVGASPIAIAIRLDDIVWFTRNMIYSITLIDYA